jgi:hypothetical protein
MITLMGNGDAFTTSSELMSELRAIADARHLLPPDMFGTSARLIALSRLASTVLRSSTVPAHLYEVLHRDALRLKELFRDGVEAGPALDELDYLIARTQSTLVEIGCSAPPLGSVAPDSSRTARSGLMTLAQDYGKEAARDRATAIWFLWTAGVLVGGSLGLAWRGLVVALHDDTLRVSVFAGYVGVAAFMACTAAVVVMLAMRVHTASREAFRLEHQVKAIDPFLYSLPEPQRNLLKGVMLRRLFPRLLEDDDPLREPEWPSPYEVVTLLTKWKSESTEKGDKGGPARSTQSG